MKSKLLTVSFITVFSIVLWVFVSFSNDFSTTIKLPVSIVDVPEGLAVNNLSAQEVMLSVKGKGWQLAQLSFGVEHELSLRFSNESKSQRVSVNTRAALEQNSWFPSVVQITMVEPEQISYSFEKIYRKSVEVIQKTTLEFKPGYGLVSEIKMDPDSVAISGPQSIVEKINSVVTVEVTLEDLEKRSSIDISLQSIANITYSVERVTIEFDVQKIVDKTFENVLVMSKNVPPSRELSLSPDRVKVIIRGGINHLGKLTNNDLKLYIYYQQALEDTLGSIEPHIDIPPFTSLVDIRPRRLEYIINQY